MLWVMLYFAEAKERCTNDHFRCEIDGTCIPSSWLCDEHIDCDDGSDEIDCSKYIIYFNMKVNFKAWIFKSSPVNSMSSNAEADKNVSKEGRIILLFIIAKQSLGPKQLFLSFLDGFVMETKIVQMEVMNSIVGKKQSMKKTSVL